MTGQGAGLPFSAAAPERESSCPRAPSGALGYTCLRRCKQGLWAWRPEQPGTVRGTAALWTRGASGTCMGSGLCPGGARATPLCSPTPVSVSHPVFFFSPGSKAVTPSEVVLPPFRSVRCFHGTS